MAVIPADPHVVDTSYGSVTAALHTGRRTHNERARQPIRHGMAPAIGGSTSRCDTDSLGAGYTVVGD
ncbi:hypothetical protein [Chloroflexus sp.]|uniref:hypothetical protein n=1 Tax=Chloroflexus sp. TaxID=1904827 RepID=UPI002ADD6276|nr:hypothetical protein [Chloroflexus sp.]